MPLLVLFGGGAAYPPPSVLYPQRGEQSLWFGSTEISPPNLNAAS